MAVDVALPHLDRPFDYLVPAGDDASARPGCRVRVRFAGQLVDGFLLERVAHSGHDGKLSYLERVVSPEPVLASEIAELAREVADRYAGTLADVLRLAIPPRHARVEAEPASAPPSPPPPPDLGPWVDYETGPEFLRALSAGFAPRAVWTALPGPDWPVAVAHAVAATLASDRGAVVVVPDGRDLSRVDTALTEVLGAGHHVTLAARHGAAERYRRWLAVRRGVVRAAVGSRAAMFAPVTRLGLVVLWDDGDDLHVERRAPYPHAREVLALRAHRAGAAALIGGFARSVEATRLVATGWAHPLVAGRATIRRRAPRVRATGEDTELARDQAAHSARLPSLALRVARTALRVGPVLVQVPRAGYVPTLACGRCRAVARCTACGGPLALRTAHAAPSCRWCGRIAGKWSCRRCGGQRVRAMTVGTSRTAEELGRGFPGVPVRVSSHDGLVDAVGPDPLLVVSTPGAEPVATRGYAAALLLDGWVSLARPDLHAAEETLRRWLNAAALVRGATEGGTVVVVADAQLRPVQALVRWDPVTHAERELAERAELGFPPATRFAAVSGRPADVADFLAVAELPAAAEVLGPVPVGEQPGGEERGRRALIRVPSTTAAELARALQAAQAVRSARKVGSAVRVQMDPIELG